MSRQSGNPVTLSTHPGSDGRQTRADAAGLSPAGRIWETLQVITAIGSPLALGTAMLFYFGWSRSQAQARAFGADVSVFDMTPQDYALRSIDAIFFPSLLLVFATLAGLWLHRMLTGDHLPGPWLARLPVPARIRAPRAVWARRVTVIMARAWIVLLPSAAALLAVAEPFGRLTLPFWLGMAIFGRAYGSILRRRIAGDPTRTSRPVLALVTALFMIMLFWQTERLADLFGRATAQDIKDDPARSLPLATLYSARKLHITAPDVVETRQSGPDESYRYRYDRLFLLQRSGGKYFFVSGGWDHGDGRLIVVQDNESVRLDFSR